MFQHYRVTVEKLDSPAASAASVELWVSPSPPCSPPSAAATACRTATSGGASLYLQAHLKSRDQLVAVFTPHVG